MKAFVEGSGCSLNQSETEQIRGFLLRNGFSLVQEPKEAGLLVLNACAVKEQTESKMLRRIRQLNAIARERDSILVVFGCLPKINREAVEQISGSIVQFGPRLSELASFLGLPVQDFSPSLEEKKSSPVVSIVPIALGCLGDCSYCCVRNARGNLKSYSPGSLSQKFQRALKGSKEIWLTAQDCGCYGFDIGETLPGLLNGLLSREGEFRVRVGMSNPGHVLGFLDEYLDAFSDARVYKFFHLPVQSGSNSVLKAMKRGYTREDFLGLVGAVRDKFPDAVVATDLIVGFPGETRGDFEQTLGLVSEVEPDVVNISRFGARPNTVAAVLPGQLHGRVKKERSRALTDLCNAISLARNRCFVGTRQRVLLNEVGSSGGLVGRALNYKPVVVNSGNLGEFLDVGVVGAFSTYLLGNPL